MTLFIFLIGFVYFLDVLTKVAVRRFMPLGSDIPVTSFFSLVHVENTGIAFGMFQDKNIYFAIFGAVLVGFMIFYAWRLLRHDRMEAFVLAIISGGALGNLTDRFLHGRVTDFLDFYWKTHHWPAFNVADSAICIGAGLLIVTSFRRSGPS